MDWRLVGGLKADGQISLADAHATALVHERNATLTAGADDNFEELPKDVEQLHFRQSSV